MTEIGECAFAFSTNITGVTLPEGLRRIGSQAFEQLPLTEIHIPSTVEEVSGLSFRSCGKLKSITVAEGNHVYDSRDNCNAIIHTGSNAIIVGCANTQIPDGIKIIAEDAFFERGLTELPYMPSSVERLSHTSFYGNPFTKIVLPEGVKYLDGCVFQDCGDLKSVTIPSTMKEINGAFSGCSSITEFYTLAAPFDISEESFGGDVYDRATLYVPQDTKERYMTKEGWKNFKRIAESNGDGTYTMPIDVTPVTLHDNCLYLNRVETYKNTDVTLSIRMRNVFTEAEGFSFDLVLPEGVTVATDADGFPEAYLSTERTTPRKTNTFEATFMADGTLRVFAASTNGSVIEGSDGEVCTVKIHVGDIDGGEHAIYLKNISISDTNAQSHDMDLMTSMLFIFSYLTGDANSDGKITVADYIAIAHHIMGKTTANFSEKAADANLDGKVNVADYTAVAHLILYGSIGRPTEARSLKARSSASVESLDNVLYIDDVTAKPGQELTLSVKMKNAVQAEGFSFELTLPEGFEFVLDDEGFPQASLSTERTTTRKTNTFETAIMADGSLRVFAASTNGSVISGNDGEVCTVVIKVPAAIEDGSYPVLLSNISISDSEAVSYDVPLMQSTITIGDAAQPAMNGDVNGDGKVDVADINAIFSIIATNAKMQEKVGE